jgi:hypothetical protein
MDCYTRIYFFLSPDVHQHFVVCRCEHMIRLGLLSESSNLVLTGEMLDMVSRAIGY